MTFEDLYNLQRFLDAQNKKYVALLNLANGYKMIGNAVPVNLS